MSAAYAKRFEAVFLCAHPKGPKMSYYGAAKYLHKSSEIVRNWVKRYQEANTVDDLPNRSLKRGTQEKEDKAIIRLFEKNPTFSLRRAQMFLAKKDVNVSLMTIKRRSEEKNMKWRSTIAKPLLKKNAY